jgi:hypothetical protein
MIGGSKYKILKTRQRKNNTKVNIEKYCFLRDCLSYNEVCIIEKQSQRDKLYPRNHGH